MMTRDGEAAGGRNTAAARRLKHSSASARRHQPLALLCEDQTPIDLGIRFFVSRMTASPICRNLLRTILQPDCSRHPGIMSIVFMERHAEKLAHTRYR